MSEITLKLTPLQARILWGVVDGAADAGACDGGLEPFEADALNQITDKLLRSHDKWKKCPLPAAPTATGGR